MGIFEKAAFNLSLYVTQSHTDSGDLCRTHLSARHAVEAVSTLEHTLPTVIFSQRPGRHFYFLGAVEPNWAPQGLEKLNLLNSTCSRYTWSSGIAAFI